VNVTVTEPLAALATVGVARAADGVTSGVETADAPDRPVPLPLGVTVKCVAVPFVSPVTVQLCEPAATAVVQVKLPADEVTV